MTPRRLLQRANALVPTCPDGVVILTYHLVGAGLRSPVDIPLSMFLGHLEQLAGLVVTLDEGIEHLRNSRQGTRVVLTFDDAFENFHRVVWPVLLAAAVPSALYVPTDFIDGKGTSPLRGAEALAPCTWGQLREMASSGLVTIGSHSRTHRNLSRLPSDQVRSEVLDSKSRLEDALELPIRSFCYPGGRSSPAVAGVVTATYQTAVIRGGSKLQPSRWSPWGLERVPIRRDSPMHLLPILRPSRWLEEWLATRLGRVRDRANWIRSCVRVT